VIALGISTAGYTAEIFAGCIQDLPHGEIEAAVSFGMPRMKIYRYVLVVVTHEMGFARNVSNHTIFLHQGRIEEEGDPAEILDRPASPRLQQFLAGSRK
jgi:ABC-type polar amino acid transport system ATPase subunit